MKNIKTIILVTSTVTVICGAMVGTTIKSMADDASPAPAAAPTAALPHWTNHGLAVAGYDTPEAALKTLLWSVNSGDADTFLASFSPEATARIQKAWAGKFDKILGTLRSGMGKTTNFQVTGEQSTNSETTVDLLSTLGDGRKYDRKFTFKKIGSDWKCDRVFPIPQLEEQDKD